MAATAHQTQPAQSFVGVHAEADAELFDVFDSNEVHQGTQPRSKCHREGLWHRAVYALLFNTQHQLLIQKRSLAKKVSPGKWDLSAAEHLQPGEPYLTAAARGLEEELGVSLPPTTNPTAGSSSTQGTAQGGHMNGVTSTSSSNIQGAPQGHTEGGHPSVQASAIDSVSCSKEADKRASLQALCSKLKGPLAPRHPRQLDMPEINIKDYEFVETYSLDGYEGAIMYNSEEVSEVAWMSIPEIAKRMRESPDEFTPWFLHEARTLGWLSQ